ncbi:penicillin-binding protein 2 [Effusibacillus consociatus]|uniref:Penicillin-binding protein 2 n=1 Tax=Effusibacillus consociatus TaxID=1117041 RepID=A0ABV9PWI6_9BACL
MEKQSQYNGRLYILFLILFIGLVILLLRLSFIQLGKAEEFAATAEANRYAQQVIPAPRGRFLDRSGEVLVDNKPSFTIQFTGHDDNVKQHIEKIAEQLVPVLSDEKEKISKEDLISIMKGEKDDLPPSTPRKLKVKATAQQVAYVKEHLHELPGVSVVPEAMRDYPLKTFASHVIGYLGPITRENWPKYQGKGYRMTDRVGYTGLEAQYEEYLKGTDGANRVEVNINGQPVHHDDTGAYTEKKPVPGNDLVLTLNKKLQLATEEALAERVNALKEKTKVRNAAAVAMDPNTGEVLAMASYPSFDPNHWVNGISPQNYKMFQPAEFNHAVEFPYAPGSTVKMLTTMVGLKEGVVKPEERIFDSGVTNISGFKAKSWSSGLGWNNGKEAIAKSSNAYMFTIGMRLAKHNMIGQTNMKNWMEQYDKPAVNKFLQYQKDFGLGVKTGIDLPYEAVGEHYYGEYESINLPFLAIGQNQTRTPLQLTQYVSTIANGGKRMKPFLVKEIVDPNQNVIKKTEPEVLNTVSFSPEIIQYVREGMWQVTHEKYGTAYSIFANKSYNVAGKTGTAETGRKTENYWFVGYAPYENPQIVIAVVVPEGPVGAHSYELWGPIAEKMLDTFFGVTEADKTKK